MKSTISRCSRLSSAARRCWALVPSGLTISSARQLQRVTSKVYNRRHNGHVHGNAYFRHLDCKEYGDHEYFQVHNPPPPLYGHVHGNPIGLAWTADGTVTMSVAACIGSTLGDG